MCSGSRCVRSCTRATTEPIKRGLLSGPRTAHTGNKRLPITNMNRRLKGLLPKVAVRFAALRGCGQTGGFRPWGARQRRAHAGQGPSSRTKAFNRTACRSAPRSRVDERAIARGGARQANSISHGRVFCANGSPPPGRLPMATYPPCTPSRHHAHRLPRVLVKRPEEQDASPMLDCKNEPHGLHASGERERSGMVAAETCWTIGWPASRASRASGKPGR
jgi:hypothetical protein